MPRFAANLTMLFQEVPFLERFALAREHGFQFVEYLFPYAYPAEQLKQQLKTHQLQQVLFNLPAGDWSQGERGIACLPSRRNEFLNGIETAINYATLLDVKQVNCLAGIQASHIDSTAQWACLIENLRYAHTTLANEGIQLVFEAINSKVDMPGFFIDSLEKSQRVLNEVPGIKFQFDIYHMQVMHGDILRNIEKFLPHIAHIQFADNPGRHEPGTGELNFPTIFKQLNKLGYNGFTAAEYIPEQNTSSSLEWLRRVN